MLCMLFIDIRIFALLGKDRSNFFFISFIPFCIDYTAVYFVKVETMKVKSIERNQSKFYS